MHPNWEHPNPAKHCSTSKWSSAIRPMPQYPRTWNGADSGKGPNSPENTPGLSRGHRWELVRARICREVHSWGLKRREHPDGVTVGLKAHRNAGRPQSFGAVHVGRSSLTRGELFVRPLAHNARFLFQEVGRCFSVVRLNGADRTPRYGSSAVVFSTAPYIRVTVAICSEDRPFRGNQKSPRGSRTGEALCTDPINQLASPPSAEPFRGDCAPLRPVAQGSKVPSRRRLSQRLMSPNSAATVFIWARRFVGVREGCGSPECHPRASRSQFVLVDETTEPVRSS